MVWFLIALVVMIALGFGVFIIVFVVNLVINIDYNCNQKFLDMQYGLLKSKTVRKINVATSHLLQSTGHCNKPYFYLFLIVKIYLLIKF